jgi:hypothetical protein
MAPAALISASRRSATQKRTKSCYLVYFVKMLSVVNISRDWSITSLTFSDKISAQKACRDWELIDRADWQLEIKFKACSMSSPSRSFRNSKCDSSSSDHLDIDHIVCAFRQSKSFLCPLRELIEASPPKPLPDGNLPSNDTFFCQREDMTPLDGNQMNCSNITWSSFDFDRVSFHRLCEDTHYQMRWWLVDTVTV